MEMQVESIKEFATKKDFVQIAPSVRTNTNGYPFLTFMNSKNEAENIYFSKAAAKNVDAGVAVNKEMLSSHQIGYTTNAEGEVRIKIISNSQRLDLADLF